MIDFTRIFNKTAGCEEDKRSRIENAVYTLKTEFTADCMISQDAANALDVMYDLAADHVSKKALMRALRMLADIQGQGDGYNFVEPDHVIRLILRETKMEDTDGLLEHNRIT